MMQSESANREDAASKMRTSTFRRIGDILRIGMYLGRYDVE